MELAEFIRTNRWCLRKESLELLIRDCDKQNGVVKTVVYPTPLYADKCVEIQYKQTVAKSLPLQSSVVSGVYYELLLTDDGQDKNVFINMWGTSEELEYTCVYHNGRIIRWGIWAIELMQTLPEQLARLAHSVSEDDVRSCVEAFHGTEAHSGGFVDTEIALTLQWNSEEMDTVEIYEKDRSGMLLDFLE